MATEAERLQFRDPKQSRELAERLAKLTAHRAEDPVSLMHVCGSHEQAIARFGLRPAFPKALRVIMGPGCPVCVTDAPEVDEAVALAHAGVCVASYGDMLRVPGSAGGISSLLTPLLVPQPQLYPSGTRDPFELPADSAAAIYGRSPVDAPVPFGYFAAAFSCTHPQ